MDAKITKSRLGLLLSYDWIKILCICLAAVLVWMLLFTTLATRATNGQRFEIYTYPGVQIKNVSPSLEILHQKNALSYDVLEVTVNDLEDNSYKDTILQAHFAAGQGDVMFVADSPETYDDSGNLESLGKLQDFLLRYRSNAIWLGEETFDEATLGIEYASTFPSYFADCEAYLNRFYGGDFQNGSLDRDAVRENFEARMAKDKRFKTQEQWDAGLEQEYERIENLCASYKRVREWVSNDSPDDPIELRKSLVPIDRNNDGAIEKGEWYEGTFAFDLGNIQNISQFAVNETGESATGEDLCMCVLQTGSSGENDLRYEPFTFLTYLVDTYDS